MTTAEPRGVGGGRWGCGSETYLSQHDNGAGVQSQEGAILEAVLHQQTTHEG